MDFKNVFAHASMAHTFIANLHGSELLHLLDDGGNGACTNGTATLTDSETQTLLHSYRCGSAQRSSDTLSPGMHISTPSGSSHNTGNVSSSEVELRTVVVEERSMTATLVLGQNVYLTGELVMRGDGAGLSQNLSSLDLSSLNTTKQSTDVITSLAFVQQLVEHLNAGDKPPYGSHP